MNGIDWSIFFIFPLVLGATLSYLYWGPYRRLSDINQIFDKGYRLPALPILLFIVLIMSAVVFLAIQAIRLTFFLKVIMSLIHSDGVLQAVEVIGATFFAIGIICEFIVFAHLFFYVYLCYKGATKDTAVRSQVLSKEQPNTVIFIPACDEYSSTIERSLCSVKKLTYSNLQVFLVENSRNPTCKKTALLLAQKYGVKAIDLANRGTKAGALNDARRLIDRKAKYLMVIDADQSLQGNILNDLIPILEATPDLAFIQTAQAYENFNSSLLTYAAAQQQMLVYDCVMEGKATRNLVPCFGTNFVMRFDALDSVGGWDESNVTEDLSTSFHFHLRGWQSMYIKKIYALGLSPPTLDAYWRQQKRWATGNSSLALSIFKDTMFCRRRLNAISGDYLWSSGFYLNTFFITLLSLLPAGMLIFGFITTWSGLSFAYATKSFYWMYTSLYIIYVMVLFFPLLNMHFRGYPFINMILVQALTSVTSPIYLKGVLTALLKRGPVIFETSDRIRSTTSPSKIALFTSPQLISFLLFMITGSIFTMIAFKHPWHPIPWILCFWSFIHSFSLGHFFMFRSGNIAS